MLIINDKKINKQNAEDTLNKIIDNAKYESKIKKTNINIPNPILYPNGFLKDENKMEETFRDEDRFNLKYEKQNLINHIAQIPYRKILGYIGPFGSGKTTILNQIHKEKIREKIKRVEFQAWKYPNREHLWENFIYEIAKEIGVNEAKSIFLQLQGKPHNRLKALLIDAINWIRLGNGFGLSSLMEFILARGQNNLDLVYDLLSELLIELSKDGEEIYLIIEDIDRSGDKGIFFLETLQYFLTNKCDSKIKIKVIIPLDKQIYYQHTREYLKIINSTYIKSNNINLNHRESFATQLFSDDVCRNISSEFLGEILEYYFSLPIITGEQTIRNIKHIFKHLNTEYKKRIKRDNAKQRLDLRLFLISALKNYSKHCFKSSGTQYLRNIGSTQESTVGSSYDLFEKVFEQDLGKGTIIKINQLPHQLHFKSRSSDLIGNKHYIWSDNECIFLINNKYDNFPIHL